MDNISLLFPGETPPEYRVLPERTAHDLGLETICQAIGETDPERIIIFRIMTAITTDPDVISYRTAVFSDILRYPALREKLTKLLDRVDFLRTYGSFGKDSDASGVWELVHRLDEMDEYIACVQGIWESLGEYEVQSEGLKDLKEYARRLYEDQGFASLKADIDALKKETDKVRSVTLGVNLNERFEPNGVGIVSINSKQFTKSGVLSNFCDFLNRGNDIRPDNEWKKNYTFHAAGNELIGTDQLARTAVLMMPRGLPQLVGMAGLAGVAADSRGGDVIRTLDRAISSMLSGIVKQLKSVLSRHVRVSTQVMTGLIPELMYYVRWAEYIEKLQRLGFLLCCPVPLDPSLRDMHGSGIYNLHLANAWMEKSDGSAPVKAGTGEDSDIVLNDLDFDREHRIYLLTGANRGGKTTITQAVGLLYVLAQGGVFVPAKEFSFSPVDNIFTHYPADENQTMDLGRLGEESSRFRNLYLEATRQSLLLLNESFSTTSFEEGYYIARDVVRALKRLGVRTIYNTHMHKLAAEIDVLNEEEDSPDMLASLVVESRDGIRSYRVRVAPPGGSSYARDIAEKYGVTFEMLTQSHHS